MQRNLLLLLLDGQRVKRSRIPIPLSHTLGLPITLLHLAIHGMLESGMVRRPPRSMVMVSNKRRAPLMVAGIRVPLAGRKRVDGQHEHAADELALRHVVEEGPGNLAASPFAHFRQDSACKG